MQFQTSAVASKRCPSLTVAHVGAQVIRNMAVVTPYPFIGLCIKGMYLNFVQVSFAFGIVR